MYKPIFVCPLESLIEAATKAKEIKAKYFMMTVKVNMTGLWNDSSSYSRSCFDTLSLALECWQSHLLLAL